MPLPGVAEAKLERPCEDTITLSCQWANRDGSSTGTAIYTASWIAPKVRWMTDCSSVGLQRCVLQHFAAPVTGTAIYTALWIAPKVRLVTECSSAAAVIYSVVCSSTGTAMCT
jgi:hypothetical protein